MTYPPLPCSAAWGGRGSPGWIARVANPRAAVPWLQPSSRSSSSGMPRESGRPPKRRGRRGRMSQFARSVAAGLPPDAYVLTQNPGMFQVWGVSAGQMSRVLARPEYLTLLSSATPAASICTGTSGVTSRSPSSPTSVGKPWRSGRRRCSQNIGNATSATRSTGCKRPLGLDLRPLENIIRVLWHLMRKACDDDKYEYDPSRARRPYDAGACHARLGPESYDRVRFDWSAGSRPDGGRCQHPGRRRGHRPDHGARNRDRALRHFLGRFHLQARPVDRPPRPHHDDVRPVIHRTGADLGRRTSQRRRHVQREHVRSNR